MPLRIRDIAAYLEELAPRRLALDWDNVGLLVGHPDASLSNVLVSLNYNSEVLREALEHRANLVLCHHPPLMNPLKNLRTDSPLGALLKETLARDIHVYAAHTNLDAAGRGVNRFLAEAFALENLEVLQKTGEDPLLKLAVFVPPSHADQVRDALAQAGAGWIGNYSHCTFSSTGTGTFLAREGTNPFLGQQGAMERVKELKMETILPASIKGRVVDALLTAHPYEEPAFDLYGLVQSGSAYGLGLLGELPEKILLKDLAETIKKTLQVEKVKMVGQGDRAVRKMAVCGGSGGDLVGLAASRGADVYLTGDVKYHQAEKARDLGMALVDAGHGATENVILKPLSAYLQEKVGEGHKVFPSRINPSFWEFI